MLPNRSNLREKKIFKTAWSGLVTKLVTMGVGLMMVPLAVHYLGKEQYGVWVAITSLITMLGFMDGGAGNATINMVAHASGSKPEQLAKIISTAFFGMFGLAMLGTIFFLGAWSFIPWAHLLDVADSVIRSGDVAILVMIVGILFFLNIHVTLIGKIQRGFQEGNLDNLWSGIGSLLSLGLVYLVIQLDLGIIGFSAAFISGTLLAYLASNIHYFLYYRPDLRPRFSLIDSTHAKEIFATGGMFFVLQFASTIHAQADNVIIANMLGPEAVTGYAICMKLFLIPTAFIGLITAPLWPAYREALASGDLVWIKNIFLKTIYGSLLVSIPIALLLVIGAKSIISIWVGSEVVPSMGLVIGCAFWLIFVSIGGSVSMLLNGLELIRPQILIAISASVVNLALTIYLIPIVGVEGAIYGSLIAYLLCAILPYYFLLREYFSQKLI